MMANYIERICSIAAAAILLQTLYFKFTGAPESVFIFEKLGMEPYGRIGTGIAELIISILLLRKSTSLLGGLLGIGVITGAIVSHLFILGIEVQDDGGLLFALAVLVFLFLGITIILQKKKLVAFIHKMTPLKP
jgi:hypothetical protein